MGFRTRALAFVVVLLPAVAAADPIVDRNYAIELYEGVAIGDSAMTGMGGAGAARVLGSAGVLINASAPAIRRTTDNDRWSWDYHLDFLSGRFSTDYDNNGTVTSAGRGAQIFTAGASLRIRNWAAAVAVTGQTAGVDGSEQPGTDTPTLFAENLRTKIVIARWIERADLSIGAGIQGVSFRLRADVGDPLFSLTGVGLITGATWLPRGQNYRAALALESRIVGNQVDSATCDPAMCDPDLSDPDNQTYILPNEVESPGRAIVGFSYRFAATPWNQQIKDRWQDERSLTLATDLVFTGSSQNGFGIEAFSQQQLQRSGAHVTMSPRAGVEVEALPGRLRLRTGSYWEPQRFTGVAGRIHGTFGVELRALEFHAWGLRRGKLGATFDIARRYRNLGLSIGFWH